MAAMQVLCDTEQQSSWSVVGGPVVGRFLDVTGTVCRSIDDQVVYRVVCSFGLARLLGGL